MNLKEVISLLKKGFNVYGDTIIIQDDSTLNRQFFSFLKMFCDSSATNSTFVIGDYFFQFCEKNWDFFWTHKDKPFRIIRRNQIFYWDGEKVDISPVQKSWHLDFFAIKKLREEYSDVYIRSINKFIPRSQYNNLKGKLEPFKYEWHSIQEIASTLTGEDFKFARRCVSLKQEYQISEYKEAGLYENQFDFISKNNVYFPKDIIFNNLKLLEKILSDFKENDTLEIYFEDEFRISIKDSKNLKQLIITDKTERIDYIFQLNLKKVVKKAFFIGESVINYADVYVEGSSWLVVDLHLYDSKPQMYVDIDGTTYANFTVDYKFFV